MSRVVVRDARRSGRESLRVAQPEWLPASQNARRLIVENSEYACFARRILRAYGCRIATGDVKSLTHLISLADDIDDAMRQAVNGLRSAGYSWAEIGARLGITCQAAHHAGDRHTDPVRYQEPGTA